MTPEYSQIHANLPKSKHVSKHDEVEISRQARAGQGQGVVGSHVSKSKVMQGKLKA